jgi:ribosomal protein L37AE/L43A
MSLDKPARNPFTACPICGTPTPKNRISDQPWCCSIPCYQAFHGLEEPTHHEQRTASLENRRSRAVLERLLVQRQKARTSVDNIESVPLNPPSTV